MLYIGIDLGGTNIAAGIVDENGKILRQDSVPTLAERPIEEIVDDMAKLCLRRFRFADSSAFAEKQTNNICNVILKGGKLRTNGDFHAFVPRSHAILVFMPWPG